MPAQVMLIEDEPVMQTTIREHLADAGFAACATATSVAEAQEQLQGQGPDIVLLDQQLPDGDGIGLIAAIKDLHPDCLVIMLTAENTQESVLAAVQAGADYYLLKEPAMWTDFNQRLTSLWERHRQRTGPDTAAGDEDGPAD